MVGTGNARSPQGSPFPLGATGPMAGTGQSHSRILHQTGNTKSQGRWHGPAGHRSGGLLEAPLAKPQCRYSFLRSRSGHQSNPRPSPPSHQLLGGLGCVCTTVGNCLREEHMHISRRPSRTYLNPRWEAHAELRTGPWLVLKLRARGKAGSEWLTGVGGTPGLGSRAPQGSTGVGRGVDDSSGMCFDREGEGWAREAFLGDLGH